MSSKQVKKQEKKRQPRKWQQKKSSAAAKAPVAKAIAVAEGQRGIDSRAQDSGESNLAELTVANADVSIDVAVAFNPITIQSLSLGIVLTALRKGWSGQLDQVTFGYPYFAYVRLYKSFVTAMTSGSMDIQNAPLWYWHVVQSLNPKLLPYKTGSVNMSWVINDDVLNEIPPVLKPYLGGNINLGYIDPAAALTNGFYNISSVVYDPVLGEAALKAMFAFFKDEGFTHLSPYVDCGMQKNGSAFAVCGEEFGPAAGNTGAIVTTIYSETNIKTPILSKFATYQQPPYFRGWDRVQRSGGSACYVIPRMTEFKNKRFLYNQLPPQFKFVNFDEIYEVLSLTVAIALEINAKTQVGAPIPPCPLSPLQVQLLLRHTLMQKFNNHMAQDLQMVGNGLVTLVPFSAGINGFSYTTVNMLMPLLLAENIRCLTRKKVKLGKSSGSELDIVPVLCRPAALGQLGNYTYLDSTGTSQTVYTTVVGEVPINLTDLSYVNGGTTSYITTEGEQISVMCGIWNEWIKSISSYLTTLTDPGSEKGLSAFGCSMMTLQQKYEEVNTTANLASIAEQNRRNMKKTLSKKNLGSEPIRRKRLGASPDPLTNNAYFQDIIPTEITSTNIFLEPYTKYLRVMILPACIATLESADFSTLSMRQVFQIEPYRLQMTGVPIQLIVGPGDPPGATLYTRHYQMATLDTKSALAAPSEVEVDLVAAAEKGRGGFFSNLAGIFAEDVIGIKGGREIAGAIGGALGI